MLITLLIRAEIMAFFEIEIIDESCFCLEKDLLLTFTVTFLYSIFFGQFDSTDCFPVISMWEILDAFYIVFLLRKSGNLYRAKFLQNIVQYLNMNI